jgi:Zn-dependent alcohol dehydrogenase
MDDGKSRFKCKGKEIYHFIGLSTFSEFCVVREECLCKVKNENKMGRGDQFGFTYPNMSLGQFGAVYYNS